MQDETSQTIRIRRDSVALIDDFAKAQLTRPTRPEAARVLIDLGYSVWRERNRLDHAKVRSEP